MAAQGWPEDQVERLKTLYAAGHTASQISAEMGHVFSRNAVIGKIHRLGLERRGASWIVKINKDRPKKRSPRPRKPSNPFATRWGAFSTEVKPATPPVTPVADLIPLNTTLNDITSIQCRWIVDEVQTLFCGHLALTGSWCPTHRAIVYAPRVQPRPKHQLVLA